MGTSLVSFHWHNRDLNHNHNDQRTNGKPLGFLLLYILLLIFYFSCHNLLDQLTGNHNKLSGTFFFLLYVFSTILTTCSNYYSKVLIIPYLQLVQMETASGVRCDKEERQRLGINRALETQHVLSPRYVFLMWI